jgi:K+-sensing histidine kinase KdpD
VLAGDSGSRWGEVVICRATELARARDAQLIVVHVQIADGLAHPASQNLDRHRQLTAGLGGTYIEIAGPTAAEGLADTARARAASTVVVGRQRSRLAELTHGSVSSRLRRLLPQTPVEEVSKT